METDHASGQGEIDELVMSDEDSDIDVGTVCDRSYHGDLYGISENTQRQMRMEVSSGMDSDTYNRNHNNHNVSMNVNAEVNPDSELEYAREDCYNYRAGGRKKKSCLEFEENRNIVDRLGYV